MVVTRELFHEPFAHFLQITHRPFHENRFPRFLCHPYAAIFVARKEPQASRCDKRSAADCTADRGRFLTLPVEE